ncbi:MAG TPA: MmgE/PrpD family protein [Solirubrobacteraceae bacterium]|nr:MmgE/PrpD family protein [Solirubrobacteraceae bacterium]
MSTLAEQLAEFAAGTRFEQLPPEVVSTLKARCLDTLGVALAARGVDAALAVSDVVRRWGGPAEATSLMTGEALPAAHAALMNGTLAHALDFDDTHLPSVVHPSAALVPVALAEAEAARVSGREFLAALASGYEVSVRLSMAQFDKELGNSVFFEHGLHATASIGALAAAVVAARLRGLGAEGIANAMAIACSMAAGLAEANRTGGTVKRAHCGWAGHCAISAAMLAQSGLTGPPTCLEGRFGFFHAFCGERWHPGEVIAGLGSEWLSPAIAFKPYPCNHFTHTVADAALALRARGLTPDQVQSVTIGTAAASWRTIGDPIAEKRRPQTPYHAKFSAPFAFAAALVGGSGLGLSHEDFAPQTLGDPTRAAVADRCSVIVSEACDAIFPYHFPAIVEVQTHDGRTLTEQVLTNLGTAERPLSDDDLAVKLRSNIGADGQELRGHIAQLERAPSVSELMLAASRIAPREAA